MSTLVADIAVNVSVHKTFHYHVPDEIRGQVVSGSRVLVPFGARKITGTVIGFPEQAEVSGLKPVLETIDSPLPPSLLKLAMWMSEYYLYPPGPAIEAVVPRSVLRAKVRKVKYLRLASPGGGRGPVRGKKQAELVRLLEKQGETAFELLHGFSRATVRTLVDAGMVEIVEREEGPGAEDAPDFSPSEPPVLMPEQASAVAEINQAIDGAGFAVFLLHGVTGSGKTEVYLHAIRRLADAGKGAIVLVPEIALTPQLLSRFRRRFGTRTAVLHSGLSDRERADEYRRIKAGQVDVAIGARSAVFAPFRNLGLIVVDEEHENTYKQDEGLRYHARDVAVMRAKFENAAAVLGSATPSLESYHNALSGKFRLLRLSDRVDHRPMPEVKVVDARQRPKEPNYSPQLVTGIQERLDRGEQVLLLLNRRGFSSVLVCRECGAAVKCPGCSVSLTFHKAERALKCHYCGHLSDPPDGCPSCKGPDLKLLGAGTQKIEEELGKLFPDARMKRMDSDSVKGREAYDRLLSEVDRREVDILLGTQMVAKGHDFPAVTLVGVLDADVGLNLPDFRSSEKTFQLLTQAAGRAGRGQAAGEVIIQTMNPGHYAIRHSRTHGYEAFYNEEIVFRNQLAYPPAGRIVKLEIRSARENLAREASHSAGGRIRSLIRNREIILLGPAPCPVSKVRGRYRFQLLLLSQKREMLRYLAVEARNTVEERYGRKCRVVIDVDPVNLM